MNFELSGFAAGCLLFVFACAPAMLETARRRAVATVRIFFVGVGAMDYVKCLSGELLTTERRLDTSEVMPAVAYRVIREYELSCHGRSETQ